MVSRAQNRDAKQTLLACRGQTGSFRRCRLGSWLGPNPLVLFCWGGLLYRCSACDCDYSCCVAWPFLAAGSHPFSVCGAVFLCIGPVAEQLQGVAAASASQGGLGGGGVCFHTLLEDQPTFPSVLRSFRDWKGGIGGFFLAVSLISMDHWSFSFSYNVNSTFLQLTRILYKIICILFCGPILFTSSTIPLVVKSVFKSCFLKIKVEVWKAEPGYP